MILFDLKCEGDHVFEAWFKDGATFDRQSSKKQVACPVCGSAAVSKAPMAPRIGRGAEEPATTPTPPAASDAARVAPVIRQLQELRRMIEANGHYVGPNFPEEARKIHYGETEKRNIYGEATDDQAKDLAEEGVEFRKVPWINRHNS